MFAVPFRRHEQVDDGRLPQMSREHPYMGAPDRFVAKVEGGFVESGSPNDSVGVQAGSRSILQQC